MRGHVRKRGASWSIVVDVDPDPATGRRRQKWVSGFPTRKAAETELRRLLGIADGGGDPFPKKITLRAFVEDRLVPHWQTQGRPRPVTWHRYVELLERWVFPTLGNVDLHTIGVRHIQPVLDRVVAAGKAPSTVAQVRAAISTVFSQALRWQLVTVNPVRASQTPTIERPTLVTPNSEQIDALIAAADTPSRPGASTVWAVPVLLAGVTGARRSEVLAIRWEHVDLDAPAVRIVGALAKNDAGGYDIGAPKTKAAVRTVPLTDAAVERLRRHRREQNERRLRLGAEWVDLDLVCDAGDGSPLSPDGFSQAFVRLAKRVGLPGVRLHDMRHGYGTILAKRLRRAELTAQVLGHSNISFTMRTYIHPDEEDLRQVKAALEEAFGS